MWSQQDHNSQAKLEHTHTHTFNGPLSGTTRVSRYQKGKTNLDFTEARDRQWQWHQLGHMQVCTSLQTNNHASTPPLRFLQAGCPSCRPTNSVKALKGWRRTRTLQRKLAVSYTCSKCHNINTYYQQPYPSSVLTVDVDDKLRLLSRG